jgi:hypothetical protein
MIEVLKQMVEALEVDAYVYNGEKSWAAIQAGKQAIAEWESQEPVAINWGAVHEKLELVWYRELSADEGLDEIQDLVHTHPPQRTWVGLTDEEICMFSMWLDSKSDATVFTAIEARLKELNT